MDVLSVWYQSIYNVYINKICGEMRKNKLLVYHLGMSPIYA